MNIAVLSGGGDLSPGDNTAQDSTTVVARDPDLTIVKQHSDPFVTGQTGATYRITVSNAGSGPTEGEVVVSDGVPAGMRPVSASGDGWSCGFDGQLMQCRRSDVLAPGAAYPVVTLIVDVLPEASSVPNTVSVAGGGDSRPDNNTAVDYTNINVVADPTISLTLNSPLLIGADAVYEAQVTNLGPGRAGGKTEVVTELPAGLLPIQGVGSGWTCSVLDRQIRCTRFGTLDANSTFPDITLRARVRVAPGDVTVGANVIPSQDSNPDNNRAEVTATAEVPVAALAITKTASRPAVRIGETLTYRLEITNTGQIPVQQTVVSDLPPRGFTRVEASTVSSSSRSTRESVTTGSGAELTWQLGTVQPHETVVILYDVRVGADARGGPQDNRATVSGFDAVRRAVTAGPAIATVDVLTDSFTMLQALVGRVYEDVDGDGQFTTADRPIANARLITSTGQAAITDPAGLYNIPSLGAGSVAVSLDKDTLPSQLTTADDGPGGRSWTRLLRTPIGGGSLLLQNYPLKRAAGSASELPPAVAAPVDGSAPLDEVMPESTAGSLPPRREYESQARFEPVHRAWRAVSSAVPRRSSTSSRKTTTRGGMAASSTRAACSRRATG